MDTARMARGENSTELLTGVEFFDALRHVVGFLSYAETADPLGQVVEQIVNQPALSQSRLLLRILVAVVRGRGDFRRAELSALDGATRALVIRLLDLRKVGSRPDQDWADAVKTAEAASA